MMTFIIFLKQTREMTVWVMVLTLAYLVFTTQASHCGDGQHCMDCDITTGECLTACSKGYFDRTCSSKCSNGCKNNACVSTDDGIENCTEGCVLGFQGTKCKTQCYSPGVKCTKCQNGCLGEFCQMGSSCVSGCVDSFFGSACRNCSSRCKTCNKTTGACDECHPPYIGSQCERSCVHCLGSCGAGCEQECKPGFYGYWCDKMCSRHCKNANKTSKYDERECHKKTGDCSQGCDVGWYGTNCSSECNSNCINMSCTSFGDCVHGCIPGYFGRDCTCSGNCFNGSCYAENGSCAEGCTNNFYGSFCNVSCDACLGGVCDQKTGTCIRGCNITVTGCDPPCTHDCPIDHCLTEKNCHTATPTEKNNHRITIGIATMLLLCAVGISMTNVIICFRKRLAREHQVQPYYSDYQSHTYWEIRDTDMATECQPNQTNSLEEQVPNMLVLADHFDDMNDREIRNVASIEESSLDLQSYSHLENANQISNCPYVDDRYISPVVECSPRTQTVISEFDNIDSGHTDE